MRSIKIFRSTSLFIFITLLTVTNVRAHMAVRDDEDDYDEQARVVRISLLRGDVSLKRAGSKKWERATLNFPLVEGDRLATGSDSRVEIQIDAYNFVHLGEYSVLDVVTLRDEGIALSLAEGTASVRLARFDRDREYFEVDAPKTTMAAQQRGLYRLDVARSGSVRVTVRDGGRARIYSETSGFTLRDGRSAELVYEGSDAGDWELTSARDFDEWDRWVNDRERYLAARLRYEQRDRYYDRHVWGAEELDVYGDWVHTTNYGWVWRPHVTVINNYHNWAPYRYGRWTWCPPYGWTWVGDEPWGWAPYHYGRWVYQDNYWCWAPRGYYRYKRSWWRPALVAFIYIPTSYGEHVAWYPLGYHQADPRARYYVQRAPDRLTPLRADEIAGLQRINPVYQRAVTTLPAREFGRQAVRTQPATTELARRAITSEPVRGRLPIRPDDSETNSAAGAERRPGLTVVRPASGGPARALPERPTGAAARQPGVALDGELRRTRVYNGREPRPAVSGVEGGTGSPETRDTGAVTRPARPARLSVEPRITNDGNRHDTSQPIVRPARPRQPNPQDEQPHPPGTNERPERRDRRDDPDNDGPRPVERPARPVRPNPGEERPAPADVPERPKEREYRPLPYPEPREDRPEPREERRASPSREERHQPREDRPIIREERPAPPPREERPMPREERPAPPPPREERHSAPPPERHSPPPESAPARPAEPPREREAPARPSRKSEIP